MALTNVVSSSMCAATSQSGVLQQQQYADI